MVLSMLANDFLIIVFIISIEKSVEYFGLNVYISGGKNDRTTKRGPLHEIRSTHP